MWILLADENFNNDIVRGVRRRLPAARIVTVQKEGLAGTTDSELLELADERGLILLTHDVNTVPGFAK
jgi:predicted nuclease of predicted toxin-antitoxin system